MRRTSTVIVALCAVLALALVWMFPRTTTNVMAQGGGGFVAGRALGETTGGGMAQYGAAEQSVTSASMAAQAATNWSNYVASRSSWSLSSADLTRLGNADWAARQAGPAVITAQQLANAATQIVNSTLSGMSASQQQALFNADTSISTPTGTYAFSQPGAQYVSAAQNDSGGVTVTINAQAFSDQKSFFQTNSPGMVSSGPNFYPSEAVLVAYSLVSGDTGYGSTFVTPTYQTLSELTGLSLSGQLLFGDSGYFCRRPMSTFLTESNMNQFFSDLGF